MSIHTILGAGGVIARELATELTGNKQRVRLVSRHPAGRTGAEIVAADLTDPVQTIQAVKGSSVVYLCAGLKYDYSVWKKQWPKIMTNTIEACQQAQAKLIFFDNVYMYGRVDGPMTENTPYDPCSRKGDLRARIATQLMSEVRKGHITASIARSADFYGPGSGKTGILNLLVFANLAKGKKAQWLANAGLEHSFTHTGDAAKALYLLARDESSWNQAWHLPTSSAPLTGSEYIGLAAEKMNVSSRYTLLRKWMVGLGGIFDKTTSEIKEMLYQYEYPYLFDSSKFEKAYNFQPTPYEEGIGATADVYRSGTAAGQDAPGTMA